MAEPQVINGNGNGNGQAPAFEQEEGEARIPAYVWDSLDIDLFIKVANMSILNPTFSMWVPIMFFAQGWPSDSMVMRVSLIYFGFTAIVYILNLSSRVYLNRSWQHGLPGIFSARRADWGEEVVVITGGSKGLGRTIVETMGTRNVAVCVLDIEADEEMSEKEWDDVYYYKCDVSDRAQVMAAAERIKKDVGNPTILINNAGVMNAKRILDLSEDDVRRTFGTNTLSHFWTIQAFLPKMIENKKGHIVTVSSVLGDFGVSQLTDYCASKAAVATMHEALRYEVKTKYPDAYPSLRFTLLQLGHLRTSLFSRLSLSQAPSPSLARFLAPTVEPHAVAKQVIAALDCVESREIAAPWYGNWTWALRGLPSWGRDVMRWLAGSESSLDEYDLSSSSASPLGKQKSE